MFWTTPVILILSIFATATFGATGSHIYRMYAGEDPYLTPPHPKSSPPVPIVGNQIMGSRYPSRRSNIQATTSLRIKPSRNPGPMYSNPYGIRPKNVVGSGPYGHRNIKPKINPEVKSGRLGPRLRPIPPARSKPTVNESPNSLVLRPNERTDQVRMKPVHEEGIIPKMAVYVNAFPESAQTKSDISKDVTRSTNYEPLGDYAKF